MLSVSRHLFPLAMDGVLRAHLDFKALTERVFAFYSTLLIVWRTRIAALVFLNV